MKKSMSSLAIVVVSLLLISSLSWLFLYSKAASRPIKTPFAHPFLELAHVGGRPLVLIQNAGVEGRTLKTSLETMIQALRDLPPDTKSNRIRAGLWLDVRLDANGQTIVSESATLKGGALEGKPIELASTAECESTGLATLESIAESIKGMPVVLNLIARKPGMSQAILKIWGEGKPLSRDTVAIQSESDGILKEMREADAQGFYGSSQATLIQLEVLSVIKLAPLADLKNDALISVISDGDKPRVREATLNEAHRRGLKRYAGPIKTLQEGQELLGQRYDGLVVRNWQLLQELIANPFQ